MSIKNPTPKRILTAGLTLAIGLFTALPSYAVPLLWTLDNVVFSDDAAASGSFVYDADTNLYSDLNLVSSPGSIVTSSHSYPFIAPTFTGPSQLLALVSAPIGGTDQTDISYLYLDFIGDLTNAGGRLSVRGGPQGFTSLGVCASLNCGVSRDFNLFRSGSVISAAVPEPSTMGLVGLGLLGMGFARKLQRKG